MTDMALATRDSRAEPSRLHRLFRWLAGDLRAALAILVLLVLVIVAIGAPWIAPYQPTAQDVNNMLAAPGPEHLLGTDDLGRDIFSRLIYGAPATVYASVLAVSVAIAIGLPVGLVAGFFGGWTDDIISRVIDTFLSFPAIVLAIAVTGALGIGLTNGMIAVGIVMFPALAQNRAGPDADRAPGTLCRCLPLLRRAGLAYPVEACAAERAAAGDRSGDAAVGGGLARRSQPELPRAWYPAT